MKSNLKKDIIESIPPKKAWIVLGLYIAFMVCLAFLLPQFIDREWLRSIVDQTGIWGIGVFLVIEYFYIIFVPIFNTTIHLAAGYIFGGNLGWVLNFITTTAGLFTIILLVKKFGRPLIEKIVPRQIVNRYDKVARRFGPLALFIIYVLPGFPDDEMTYLIAASPVKFSRFILPVLLGNVTKAAISYIGDEGSSGFDLAIGSRIVVLVVGLILIGVQEYFYQRTSRKPEPSLK